jgi:hypothetical protein
MSVWVRSPLGDELAPIPPIPYTPGAVYADRKPENWATSRDHRAGRRGRARSLRGAGAARGELPSSGASPFERANVWGEWRPFSTIRPRDPVVVAVLRDEHDVATGQRWVDGAALHVVAVQNAALDVCSQGLPAAATTRLRKRRYHNPVIDTESLLLKAAASRICLCQPESASRLNQQQVTRRRVTIAT